MRFAFLLDTFLLIGYFEFRLWSFAGVLILMAVVCVAAWLIQQAVQAGERKVIEDLADDFTDAWIEADVP